MDASPESIAALRQQLAESRARLAQSKADMTASLDVPARVRQNIRQRVSSHPWKWALLAVAGGVLAARTLPLAVSLLRTAGSRRLVGALMGTVVPLALRAGLNAVASRRPDLAAFFHGDSDPPSPDADHPTRRSEFDPGKYNPS